MKIFGTVLIGAGYDFRTDQLTHSTTADVDSVSIFQRVVSDAGVLLLASDLPCAENFKGSEFAFFPGRDAGAEAVTFKIDRACPSGPHTVRVRYLVSQGNDATLHLYAEGGEDHVIKFEEPTGFGDEVQSEDFYFLCGHWNYVALNPTNLIIKPHNID